MMNSMSNYICNINTPSTKQLLRKCRGVVAIYRIKNFLSIIIKGRRLFVLIYYNEMIREDSEK